MTTNYPPPYSGIIPGQVVTGGQLPGQYVVAPQGQPMMYGQQVQQGQPMMYQPQSQNIMYNQQLLYNAQRFAMPISWMERPTVNGCPPGLEYLTRIDQLLVKQRINLFEAMTGYGIRNTYDVKNTLGQNIYFAKEESGCCELYWCGHNRKFKIHIYDNADREVIEIRRQNRCKRPGCARDLITVESPPGTTVGYVKQNHYSGVIHYTIMDSKENVVLKIVGPSCCFCYCPGDDIPFRVVSTDESREIGRISRMWSNLVQEYFTDADNFGIQFPMDLDVKIKAVVLGAVFLIDYNFFERPNMNRRKYLG